MKKQTVFIMVMGALLLMALSSCAPEGHTNKEYGFFSGILHGLLIIIAVIGKLFGADTGIYAAHNTGFFYWLGFLIGIGCLGGGSGAASRKRR